MFGGKDFKQWKRLKKTQAFLQVLSSRVGIPTLELIKYNEGGNGERHTWAHPQVAINNAQWISPEFDVDVSKWVFELMVTGSVTLGKEMSSTQLQLEYKKQVEETTQQLELAQQDYAKLRQLHNSLKFKRNYHELDKGDCVYICHNKLEPPDRFKIGKTDNINKTLRVYRRNAPYTLLDYLFFTSKSTLLEDSLLTKYLSERRPMNHEVVEDIKLETILEDIQKIVDFINIPGSEGSKENIDKYNADINTPDAEVVGNDHMFIVESDDESDEEDDEIKERVGNVEKRVEVVEKKMEEQKQDFSKLLLEMEKYTNKKLEEVLRQFKLPVSGVKDVKKKRIRAFIEKSDSKTRINIDIVTIPEKRTCDTCDEEKDLTKENFRVFGYGFKKRCLKCDIEDCQTNRGVRKDIKTEIKKGMETAVCSKCKKTLSTEDFYKNKANKSGRESQCKNCSSKNKNRQINGGVLKKMRLIKKRPEGVSVHEKWCPDCTQVKSKSDFRKRSTAKDGCQTYCKICDNTRSRKNRMRQKINKNI